LLFIRAVSVVFWRLRVLHRERLLTDNVIIVANHQSL
jgi:1-acyl-sn-glycerol-3-phosphate acyltransferase